jgi:hypothetical protein
VSLEVFAIRLVRPEVFDEDLPRIAVVHLATYSVAPVVGIDIGVAARAILVVYSGFRMGQ